MALGIHGHIAITGPSSTIRLNLDPTDYQPYGPTRRASRFPLIGGLQAIQDFGSVLTDGKLSISGVKVTQAVAKALDAFYRAADPTYTIRDWAGHEMTAFFAELALKPLTEFWWGPTRTAAGGGASTITFDANAVPVDGFYNDANVRVVSGTGAGGSGKVLSYVGSSRMATMVKPWEIPPTSGSGYQIADTLHEVSATFWVLAVAKLFEGAI